MVLYMFGDMIINKIQGVDSDNYSFYTDINDNDSYDKDGYHHLFLCKTILFIRRNCSLIIATPFICIPVAQDGIVLEN